MSAQLSPVPVFKGWANDGTPLAYGLLATFAAGTTTPQATYIDSTQTTPNTNPIQLDARGECALWLDPTLTYKFNLTDRNGNQISRYPVDNITSGTLFPIDSTNIHYDITAAENAAGISPSNYIYPELSLQRYGFKGDGITNDYAAINSAILVAQQYTGATIRFPQNLNVICNTGLTWDMTKVGIDLAGSVISFANLTTGYALTPFVSQTLNNVPIYTAIHPFQNGQVIGPGVSTTAVTAVSLADSHAVPNISGCSFRNISFVNFATDVTFGAGSFCISFDHCTFTTLGAGGTTYSIIQQSSSNSGERQTFIDCFWFNKAYGIHNTTGAADIFLIDCSVDGCTRSITSDGGSSVTMIGGHLEGSADTDYWLSVSSTNSSIILKGTTIVLDAPKTAFTLGYSDSTCTNGGIFIDDCPFDAGTEAYTAAFGAVFGAVLIGGTGNARVTNLIQQQNGARPGMATSLGLLAYPGFESANFTAEWTLTLAARSSTQKHSGTQSLALTANSGANASAQTSVPCLPGQYVQGSLWMLGLTIATQSATAQLTYAYLDKGGNTIGSSSAAATITTNIATFTNYPFPNGPASPAPPGTISAAVGVSVFGATSACIVYIDDVLVNVV